jgi:hypothetical protein
MPDFTPYYILLALAVLLPAAASIHSFIAGQALARSIRVSMSVLVTEDMRSWYQAREVQRQAKPASNTTGLVDMNAVAQSIDRHELAQHLRKQVGRRTMGKMLLPALALLWASPAWAHELVVSHAHPHIEWPLVLCGTILPVAALLRFYISSRLTRRG